MKKELLKSLGLLAAATAALLLVLWATKGTKFEPSLGDSANNKKNREIGVGVWSDFHLLTKKSAADVANQGPDVLAAESAVFKEFPHVASSYRLSHKVLKSNEDWDEIKAVHSDPAAIEASAQYLTQDQVFSEELSLAHFRHIDFLKRAISLKDNPAEPLVLEKVGTVLNFEPKNYQTMDEKSRQVFLGDKIDLIYVMKAYAPETLEKMIQQSEKGRLGKLVKYAEANRKFLQLVDL